MPDKNGPSVKNAPSDKRGGYHHGDLRRELLRVARAEIARNGAQDVSLSSLARLVGVSQPAPYRHFADRKALLEALAVEGFEDLTAAIAACAIAGDTPGDAPDDTALRVALAYVSFGETNIEIYRLMFASRLVPQAEPGSALAEAADTAFAQLRNLFPAAPAPAGAESATFWFWARLHGLVMLKADGFIGTALTEHVRRYQGSVLQPGV